MHVYLNIHVHINKRMHILCMYPFSVEEFKFVPDLRMFSHPLVTYNVYQYMYVCTNTHAYVYLFKEFTNQIQHQYKGKAETHTSIHTYIDTYKQGWRD